MFKNLSETLFIIMMCLGTLTSISANSWMGIWMGLEINLLSFIPMINNKNNLNYSEAALNYFLIQAFASTILLFSMIINMLLLNSMIFFSQFSLNYFFMPFKMILVTLMLKMGAAPFHFWFPNVMENISWMNNMLLMTWQKLAPMMILSYMINMNNYLLIFIFASSMMGAIGGLNQISLRKLLAFSSINHMSWMITAIMFNENLWLMYFIIYTFLNFCIILMFKIFQIYYLNQLYSMFMNSYFLKFNLFLSLLSLGGLPPFLGFIPKWMIIQSMIIMKMNFMNLFLIYMSLITLFYYIKIGLSSYMLNYSEFNWNYKIWYKNYMFIVMLNLNFMSLFTFFIMIEFLYMY